MNRVRVVGTAGLGAVLGAVAAALWWSVRGRGTVCLGGCSPSDKNLPPGDVTLALGLSRVHSSLWLCSWCSFGYDVSGKCR